MFVHVVKAGESLFSIAREYGGTPERIRQVNELTSDRLVPGMSLLIPAGPPATLMPYVVKEGDTLEKLALEFRVPPKIIRGANEPLRPEALRAGQILWIPVPLRGKRTIEVNGYLLPAGTEADAEIVREVGKHLTYLSSFSYRANTNGQLVEPPDSQMLAEAKREHILPLMTVSNFDGNNFNSDIAHRIMSSESIKQTLYENIFQMIRRKGFHGVNVDFEHMYPADRPLYNEFIRGLVSYMRPRGIPVSLALGPKTGDEPTGRWMGAFDYKTLGSLVDYIMLMTYEWGWVGGPPLPIAPLNLVRDVLRYATSVIPAEKILMGIALYGYDWATPFVTGKRAAGIPSKEALKRAVQKGVHIHWNHAAASPTYTYRGSRGEMRQVWFEDARSVMAKFHLVYEMGLRGVSYWVLGNPFPQNWALLENVFNIRKGT